MKSLSVALALPALILSACEPPKAASQQAKPSVKASKGGEEMGQPPLNIEFVKTQVVRSDLRGHDAVELDFHVKFSNKGKDSIAFLNHPNSLKIDQVGESGRTVTPLIQVKMAGPTPLDVVTLEPGEEITLIIGTLPSSKADLGKKFKARLVVWPWSHGGMKPTPISIGYMKLWPTRPMEGPWQNISISDIAPRTRPGGGAKVAFLGMRSFTVGEADFKSTAFEAKYSITNNSPKTIVHLGRSDGLGFVVSGSKGEYLTPYATMKMMAMSAWDAVVLAPGESKVCIRSTPGYRDADMEKSVKVKFSLSPWEPKHIEGLKEGEFPSYMTAFPARQMESPVFSVDRRH